jgi:hypothetical protein
VHGAIDDVHLGGSTPVLAALREAGDPGPAVNGYGAKHPTFVGLCSGDQREKVALQGGSWPLLPVVLAHHQIFSGLILNTLECPREGEEGDEFRGLPSGRDSATLRSHSSGALGLNAVQQRLGGLRGSPSPPSRAAPVS